VGPGTVIRGAAYGLGVSRALFGVFVVRPAEVVAGRITVAILGRAMSSELVGAVARDLVRYEVIERVTDHVLASEAVDRVLDRADAAGVPQRIADRLLEDGIAEQVAERLLSGPELERIVTMAMESDAMRDSVAGALESPGAERLLVLALDSPGAERLIARIIESRVVEETMARVMEDVAARLPQTEGMWTLVDEIAQSPAVTEAITHQGAGFADQVAEDLRDRSRKADARLERAAWRLFRRRTPGPRAGPGPDEATAT
jgi:hypothetical protein